MSDGPSGMIIPTVFFPTRGAFSWILDYRHAAPKWSEMILLHRVTLQQVLYIPSEKLKAQKSSVCLFFCAEIGFGGPSERDRVPLHPSAPAAAGHGG